MGGIKKHNGSLSTKSVDEAIAAAKAERREGDDFQDLVLRAASAQVAMRQGTNPFYQCGSPQDLVCAGGSFTQGSKGDSSPKVKSPRGTGSGGFSNVVGPSHTILVQILRPGARKVFC